jgi:shikimate kinase
MKNSGFTVFLDRRLEALHGQDTVNRPLLSADSRAETDARIDRLYAERHEKYAACADLTLDPDADGAAERIAQAYMRFIETGDRP